MQKMVFLFILSVAAVAGAQDDGWRNFNAGRKMRDGVGVVWRAPFGKGMSAFEVEWRDGATGDVRMVKTASGPAMRIAKLNSRGYVLVRAKEPFAVPEGMKLQAFAGCEARNADCESSFGFLRLYGTKERLSYYSKLNRQGRGGPTMTRIANTAPGMPYRKMANYTADGEGGTNVTAAIVVAGTPSTSIWSGWTVEDHAAAGNVWWEKVRNRRPPAGAAGRKEISDEEFDAVLAAEPDHTAKVERRNGFARLLMDGRENLPVFFKASTGASLKGFYGGAKMEAAGLALQSTHIRFGVTKSRNRGFWSKDGFDVHGAVKEIRKAMKLAPRSRFLLGIDLSAYPEFADEHPEEVWLNEKGRKVFGHNVHSAYALPKKMDPKRHWYWISNHSLVWRDAVKTNLTELIEELKRTGLSKNIVGVHLAGYHDAQFATVHPDYSKPAIEGFRRYLRAKYGNEAALRAAWKDTAVTFDTASAPVVGDNYGRHNYFDPETERRAIDFQTHLKRAPFAMQEDFARHVKKLFAKDVIVVRWCMSAFGGTYNSAYDIAPFVRSDAIDILCAQPAYGRRLPGFPLAVGLPVDSFHRNGKIYFNEFDLRTYGAYTGWEGELAAIQYGRAEDAEMWRTINRRLAGQMFARRMGWWYLDMAGGWFEPGPIASDIADTVSVGRDLLSRDDGKRCAQVAFAVDEDGALTRNLLAHYFNPDEQRTNGEQVQALSASGVPVDNWLLDDLLEDPALADKYRMIVFWGLYDIDERRRAFLEQLARGGRTLVFLAGTGRARGVEKIGFELGEKMFPAQHELVPEPGVDVRMYSSLHSVKFTDLIGVNRGWPWQLQSPTRLFVKEAPDVKVLARFTEDGTAALAEKTVGNSRFVYAAAFGGLSAEYFHRLAMEAGAYVPTDRPGVQVDMNGDFISMHCLRPGRYDLRLPRKSAVLNLKTGRASSAKGGTLRLELEAGETRWYRLVDNTTTGKAR